MMEYLTYFVDAYLFFYVPRFSYSLKVQMVNPKKVYAIDNGLIYTNSVSFSSDQGRLLENMVFLHLRRQTPEIYYFAEKGECDFVVLKQNHEVELVQVCWHLDEENLKRELNGLSEAMLFFGLQKGMIITYNQSDEFIIEDKRIEVIPFYKWATV